VFGPLKTLNDRLDSLEPNRSLDPAAEWHRFRAEAGVSLAREDPSPQTASKWWPESRLALSSRLVRLPGYDSTGRETIWFDDGNASRIELGATAGATGMSDFAFATQVTVAGGYYRARRRDAEGAAWGASGLGGVTTGFQYTLHQYRRRQGRAIDRMASVQPLGFAFEQRGAFGGPLVTTTLELGPDFGGVTPHAIAAYDGDARRLPFIQNARGYYFAVGGHLRASLELESGPAFLTGDFSAQGLRDVRGPNDSAGASLADVTAYYGLAAGYRAADGEVAPRVFVQRRLRVGWVGGRHAASGEVNLGAGMGATF
jgi:hypothetical protein